MPKKILDNLIIDNPQLLEIKNTILNTYLMLVKSYEQGGKLLICGNGGSAADCEHIVGELMKGFLKKRHLSHEMENKFKSLWGEQGLEIAKKLQLALPAISLVSQSSIQTAFLNDVDPELVFAQQILGYGKENDILLAISTSGNSRNILKAAQTAHVLGMQVISLTGENGGELEKISHLTIKAPAKETYRIQEFHLPIYHALCAMLEEHFFVA